MGICGSVVVFVLSIGALTGAWPAQAEEKWHLSKIDSRGFPKGILEETRRRVPEGGLPDGLVAISSGKADITAAWYDKPTRRYRHGILGDDIEAGALHVKTSDGAIRTIVLPNFEVFEDRHPRLADLDGDGKTEVVTIRSSLSRGASVTIYGLWKNQLVQRASTSFIGQSNRWLNIAGFGDFHAGKGIEIAYVTTPHIGGVLHIYSYRDGVLVRLGAMGGFSNHVIGSREMRLSAIADIDGDGRPELALPSANRRGLRIVGFAGNRLREIASVTLPAGIDKPIAVVPSRHGVSFIVGTENSEVYQISR